MIQIQKLEPHAIIPTRAHQGDLGYDLYCLDEFIIEPGDHAVIPTGIACQFPPGFGAIIHDRSSMAANGFKVGGGVIDNGYNGELKVILFNLNGNSRLLARSRFPAGSKIAQFVITPVFADDHALAVVPQLNRDVLLPNYCPSCQSMMNVKIANGIATCRSCGESMLSDVQIIRTARNSEIRNDKGFGSSGA